MQRFAASIMTLAVGLMPAAGALAADADMQSSTGTPSSALSLDFLNVTNFTLNPTDDTWLSVIQQIRAHPCFTIVGNEREWCHDKYGLTADIETMLSRTTFTAWLHTEMANAACGSTSGTAWMNCLNRVPMLSTDTMARFETNTNGSSWMTDDDEDEQPDMTGTNADLYERAGTAPTTRQNALDIIEENESNEATDTPYERSVMLWEWCESSSMGQSGCFQTFQRFVEDYDVSQDEIRDAISSN